MNNRTLRTLAGSLLALGAALLLSSCGGGGAAGNPNQGGIVAISPATGTFFAGLPATLTLQGGRTPYALSSSEPGILPVPAIVDGHSVQVVPNNPGVVDPGLQPGELPRRTVVITLRDATGLTATASIAVGQNFLTGYGVSFTPSTCPTGGTGVARVGQACAGGETAATFNATFNGSLHGNQQFRLQVIRGDFSVQDAPGVAGGNSVVVNSDHNGRVVGIIRVPVGAPLQLGIIRIIHLPTGVYADNVFTISGDSPSQALTAIPNQFTFTGPLTTTCGTGSADFLVFGGTPPYTATSLDPNVTVSPSSSGSQPGRFTLTAANPFVCVDPATIVVTDALLGRAVVTVTTEAGDTEPAPPPALVVAPEAITLSCNTSGSVSVVGGSGNYAVTSSHPGVTAVVSGNTITITRRIGDPTTLPTTAGIAVTDGATVETINVTVPAFCP